MMRNLYLLTPLFVGCIIIDDNEKYNDNWKDLDTATQLEEQEQEQDPEVDVDPDNPSDDETPLEDHEGSFTLTPNAGPQGSTFITALRSSFEIDWYSIQEITAFGAITICNFQPLFDEALLTINIPEDSQEAPVDFLVQYTDGDVDLIENAFYIDSEAQLGSAVVSPEACE